MISIEGLSKTFDTQRNRSHLAISDIDLKVADGEFVSILGPSGCGKSTLLYIVGGFVPPSTGTVLVVAGTPFELPGEPPSRMSAHSSAALRKAAALRYDRGQDRAPRVVASGRGPVAERLIGVTETHGVPVQRDAALADALTRLELDQEIPPELFAAVAEVISFLYRARPS